MIPSGFLRKASLDVIEVSSSKSLFASWKDIVKKSYNEREGKKFLSAESFNYDPANFIYIRARAISSFEKYGCNGNADAFQWAELHAAYDTFPGKGFYIEHDEDVPEKAVGIVIDAVAYPEEQYIECLCCISKNEFPVLASQIENGDIKSVSMSCVAGEAECSVCNNIATNEYELCKHMRRWADLDHNVINPYYCKGSIGKDGLPIHELNRKLAFTGLSAVKVPADGDAHIFEIFASRIKKSAAMHYEEYKNALKTKKIESAQDTISFKELYEQQLKETGSQDEALEHTLDLFTNGLFSALESGRRQELIQKAKEKINKGDLEVQSSTKIVEADKKNNESSKETIMADEKEVKKSEPKKDEKETKEKDVKVDESKESTEPKAEDKVTMEPKDLVAEVKEFLEKMKEDESYEVEEIEEMISKIDGKPEMDGMEDGSMLPAEMSPEANDDLGMGGEMDKPMGMEGLEDKPKAGGDNKLMMKYFPGEGKTASEALSKSYFKVREGKESRVFAAKDVLPANVQKLILAGKQDEVVEPENIVSQIVKMAKNSLAGVVRFASKQKTLNKKAFTEDPSLLEAWSINTKEIPREKATVTKSIDEKEANQHMEDKPKAAKSDVKSFYNRLPSKSETGAEPEVSFDKKSNQNVHVKQMREILAKQRENEAIIKEKDAKIAALEETIVKAAKQKEISEKATKITKILSSLNMKNEEEIRTMKTKFAAMSNEALDAMIEVLPMAKQADAEMATTDTEVSSDFEGGDVPAVSFESNGGSDDLAALSENWANSTLNNANNSMI